MGFFDFLKSDDPEPQLTVESSNYTPETESSKNRRGRGGGTESGNLELELEQRQNAYNDYRDKMLSGELGTEFGAGKGQEQLNQLSFLDSQVKETQQKINDRDARNLGIGAGMGALSPLGLNTAGELASEMDVGGSGQLGGNQQKSGSDFRAGPEGRERGATRDDDGDGIPNNRDPDPFNAPPPMDFIGGVEGVAGENQQRPAETSLSTEDGVPTNVPPAGRAGNPLPSASEILGGIGDMLGLTGSGRGDTGNTLGKGGLQETAFDSTGHSVPTPTPTTEGRNDAHIQNTRPNIEHTNVGSFDTSTTTNPFIEQGEERQVPDFKIFSQVLGATASLAFEAMKPVVITNPGTLLTVEFLEQFSPFGIKDSVESAVQALAKNAYSDVGNLRSTAPNRIKLRMKHEEHTVFKNPILYPFVVIAINFYLAKTDRESIRINDLTYQALYYLLTYNLKVDAQHTDYLLQLFKSYPLELDTAFIKNRDNINNLTQQEKTAIDSFIKNAINSYESVFNRKFRDDTKKYENGGTALISVLQSLDNPRFLFEVNQVFKTTDNFLLSIQDNKDILIGLMGLIYVEARGKNLLSREAILSSAMVDGIVYYNRGIAIPVQRRNVDISILEQMANPEGDRNLEGYTIEFESKNLGFFTDSNGNSILAFAGTDIKNKDDIIQNFLNMAGSPAIFTDPQYSVRYDKAKELIDNKLRQISNTNIGSLTVVGYSIGSLGAEYMSILYPDIPTRIYNPVVGRSQFTDSIFEELNQRGSNIQFNAVDLDPFSSNLKNYKDLVDINYISKSKFFNAHNLKNYLN